MKYRVFFIEHEQLVSKTKINIFDIQRNMMTFFVSYNNCVIIHTFAKHLYVK